MSYILQLQYTNIQEGRPSSSFLLIIVGKYLIKHILQKIQERLIFTSILQQSAIEIYRIEFMNASHTSFDMIIIA